jgi:hypothetical protein
MFYNPTPGPYYGRTAISKVRLYHIQASLGNGTVHNYKIISTQWNIFFCEIVILFASLDMHCWVNTSSWELAELPFHFFKAVQKKLFVFRERSTKHAQDLRTGLPDFPWCNIPKRGENIPNNHKMFIKFTKCSKNILCKRPKIYQISKKDQMSLNHTNIF